MLSSTAPTFVPDKPIYPTEIKLKNDSSYALAKLNGFPVGRRHHLQGSCQGRNKASRKQSSRAAEWWLFPLGWTPSGGEGSVARAIGRFPGGLTKRNLVLTLPDQGGMGVGKLSVLSPGPQPEERPALTSEE